MRLEFESGICHESIYQAIYAGRHYLDYLIEYLPQSRPKRGQGKTRRGPSIANRVSIHERGAEANERREAGHWEADLVAGIFKNSFLLTFVKRRARLAVAVKVPSKRADAVAEALIEALMDYPASWAKSVTFDNGTEFAQHERVAKALGVATYFADPYSSFQRGGNEQANGLIRREYPKGTCFLGLSQEKVQELVQKLNNRPRKCLLYRTPNEFFQNQREERRRALRT